MKRFYPAGLLALLLLVPLSAFAQSPVYQVNTDDEVWTEIGSTGRYSVASTSESFPDELWERPAEDQKWTDDGTTMSTTGTGKYYQYADLVSGAWGWDSTYIYVKWVVAGDGIHEGGKADPDSVGHLGHYYFYFKLDDIKAFAIEVVGGKAKDYDGSFAGGEVKIYEESAIGVAKNGAQGDTGFNNETTLNNNGRRVGNTVEVAVPWTSIPGYSAANISIPDGADEYAHVGVAVSNPSSVAELFANRKYPDTEPDGDGQQGHGVEYDTIRLANPGSANLIIVKRIINNNGGTAVVGTFGITTSAPGALNFGAGVADGANTLKYTAETLVVDANTAYTLIESDVAGYSEGTWTCTGGDNLGGGPYNNGSVTLAPGVTKTCTITNDDVAPQLTLRKVVVNNNGGTATASQWTLTATGSGGFSGNPAGAALDASLGPNAVTAGIQYALSESGGPSGYSASAWSCNGGTQNGSNITLVVGANVICTITNDDVAPQLTLRKVVTNNNGGTATASQWTLTATGSGGFSGNPAGAPLDASLGPNAVTAGVQYALSETGGPSGYSASAWSCNGGNQSGSNITLALTDNVICTITNDDIAPQLIVRKRIVNANGGQAVVGAFGITTDAGGPLAFDGGVADGADTLLYTATELPVTAGTPYSLSENNVQDYNEGSWSCTGGDGLGGGAYNAGSVTLAVGVTKTCTITNNDGTAGINLAKSVFSISESPAGTFTVVYHVTATNSGDSGGSYNIQDTFTPDTTGVTLSGSPTIALTTDGGGATGTLVSPFVNGTTPVQNRTLAAAATDVWTVTAVFVVNPATATLDMFDCVDFVNPATNTGTANGVLGSASDTDLTDNRACAPLPQINLAKSVVSINEAPAGTFTVVYSVTATNNGGGAGSYNIQDTFTPDTTGVTLSGNPTIALTTDGGGATGTLVSPFVNGSTPVQNRTIAAAATDVWTVTAKFVVNPATATLGMLDCANYANPATNTGTANGVLGSSTDIDLTDNRACAPLPQINLAKSVVSINEGPAATFTVVYSVTATNNGDGAGSYNIKDTFTPDTTGVTLSGNPTIALTTDGGGATGTLVSPFVNGTTPVQNRTLAAKATDVWTVTAVFVMNPATATLGMLDCANYANPATNTGTANGVLGSSTDIDLTDNRACAPLPQINLAKSVFSINEGPANTFTVVYDVTATNNGDGAGTYDIDDTFTPGNGVTLQGGTATIVFDSGTGTGGTVTTPFTNGGKPVDDRDLAAGAADTWRVTAVFVLDPATATFDSLDCVDFTNPATNTGTANGVLGSSTEIDFSDNRACEPLRTQTLIVVRKIFTDGNEETPVKLSLWCSSGNYAPGSVTVIPGPDATVDHIFIVYNLPQNVAGERCTVVEDAIPGYTGYYHCPEDLSNSDSDPNCIPTGEGPTSVPADNFRCEWSGVFPGHVNECTIYNVPDPVEIEVTKEWIITTTGGDYYDREADVIIGCDAEILGPTWDDDGWYYRKFKLLEGDYGNDTGEGLDEAVMTVEVIPEWYPTETPQQYTECFAVEKNVISAVEVTSDCGSWKDGTMFVAVGKSDSCTITNTLFFEGIPALNQWGMAIMTLLMLGIGMLGFRRFA